MANLGFIGTGGMGSGMAANLIKAGHKLVVTDLRREQAKAWKVKARYSKTRPRRWPNPATWCCSMLPYNQAVQAVGLGKGGLHEATSGAKTLDRFQQHRQEDHRRRQR